MAEPGDPRDRVRWNLTGGRLDDGARSRLAAHVARWRARLPGYDLRVPARSVVGVIAWGELSLDEPAPSRLVVGEAASETGRRLATLLDALAELEGLVPGARLIALSNAVAFRSTPLGFEPEPRAAGDELAYDEAPEGWVALQPIPGDEPTAAEQATPIAGAPSGPVEARAARFLASLPPRDRLALVAENELLAAGIGFSMAVVAGLRDRPRSEAMQEVYSDALSVLMFAGRSESAPTLALVLARGVPPDLDQEAIEGLCRALARNDATRDLLGALADLPGFAIRAAESGHDERWYRHPFWKVRVAAIMGTRLARERARVACSVWATIDASDLPVDEQPSTYLTELEVPIGDRDWAALAAPFGGIEPLPPLPSLADGARSRCADMRAWCRAALSARGEPIDSDEPAPAALAIDDVTRAELIRIERETLDEVRERLDELPEWIAGYQMRLDELPEDEPPD